MTKNIIILLILLFSASNSLAAERKFPSDLYDYCIWIDTNKDTDATKKYLDQDFSSFLKVPLSDPESKGSYEEFLGYIGEEYQRLYINYFSVKKDQNDPRVYLVKGRSQVKKNKNDFVGKIIISKIYSSGPTTIYSDDNEVSDEANDVIAVFADYEFFENKNQNYSGKFSGKMWFGGYFNKQNQFILKPSEATACPHYRNNQYLGTWQSYKNLKTKITGWGQYLLPGFSSFSEDPSGGGCGGYVPELKYQRRGWSPEKVPVMC